MKLYRLPVTIESPNEDNGQHFLAEIAVLPGCRAWGKTAAEALDNLQSVANAYLESYRAHGDPLPDEVEALIDKSGDTLSSEVFVVV